MKIHDSWALAFFQFICVEHEILRNTKKHCLLLLEGLSWFLKRFVRSIRLNNNVICANCDPARLPPTLTNSWMVNAWRKQAKGLLNTRLSESRGESEEIRFYFFAFVIIQVKISWCSCCVIVIYVKRHTLKEKNILYWIKIIKCHTELKLSLSMNILRK